MQLQRLCALEREKIEQEYLELIKRIEYYNLILASEKKQEALIKEELKEVKEKFSDPRRTEIVAQKEEIEIEDLIVEEDMVVTITGLRLYQAPAADRLPAAAPRRTRGNSDDHGGGRFCRTSVCRFQQGHAALFFQ